MAMDFLAGCVGGVTGVLVGHPFDTVKVRLQAQDFSNPKYRTSLEAFRFIIRTESTRALFKGMSSPLYGLAAINTVVFGVQANLQRRMKNPDSLGSYFIAGSVAGLAQCVICSPVELAKTLMQTQGEGQSYKNKSSRLYKGPINCLSRLYKKEGIRGVSRGGLLTVMRDSPSFGMYFVAYESICRLYDMPDSSAELPTFVLLVAGGLAGMTSWLVTYPIDVIKTRVQNDTAGKYQGAWDCFKKTYHGDGVSAFGRGLGATMLRAFPVNAATFTTVAWVLRLSNRVQDADDVSISLSSVTPKTEKFTKHYFPHSHLQSSVMTNFPSHHG